MPAGDQVLPRAGIFLADVSILNGDVSLRAASIAELTADERSRYDQMRSEDRRCQFLVGRLLARKALTQWFGVGWGQWRIATDDRGRPQVESPGRGVAIPSISLAHSGDHVVCGLCEAGLIGVDVEHPRQRDFVALAGMVCGEGERAEIERLSGAERAALFYRFWTLKEACSKALGTGIATPLRSLLFDCSGGRIGFHSDKWQGSAHFLCFTPAPQATAALALLAPGSDCQWRTQFFRMVSGGGIEPFAPEILVQSP